MPWKILQTPKRFWNDRKNITAYMDWLAETLNIKTMEDWYNVSAEVI